jgi:hypothetical protein
MFPMTIHFLKYDIQAKIYGPKNFVLFYQIYQCMLHVSSFSICIFLHTQILNLAPFLSSMDHNISIDYSCAPNLLYSVDLCPLKVNQ